MPTPEYKITTVQPQKANVESHSFYSSSTTNNSRECCGKCSDDEKKCCSLMCTTCIAIGVSIILIKFAC
jgi:hypothetical protein